jgi:hypothetical protein
LALRCWKSAANITASLRQQFYTSTRLHPTRHQKHPSPKATDRRKDYHRAAGAVLGARTKFSFNQHLPAMAIMAWTTTTRSTPKLLQAAATPFRYNQNIHHSTIPTDTKCIDLNHSQIYRLYVSYAPILIVYPQDRHKIDGVIDTAPNSFSQNHYRLQLRSFQHVCQPHSVFIAHHLSDHFADIFDSTTKSNSSTNPSTITPFTTRIHPPINNHTVHYKNPSTSTPLTTSLASVPVL